ncbi:MAG: hypothetical protein HPY79_06775 [Bacteroidales bacterium]|nr:hypothetical protein [Bacteroidales bacterium]
MIRFLFSLILMSLIFVLPIFSQEQEIGEEEFDLSTRNEFQIYGGVGLGIYSLNDNDSKSDKFITATGIYSLGVYYSVSNRFYVGIGYERLGFATNQDSANTAFVKNLAILTKYNAHCTEKSAIHFNLSLGTTRFKYFDQKTSTNINASSIFIEPGLGYTHFWGQHLGYYLNTSYYFTRYNKLVNKDNQPLKVNNNGFEEQFWISLNGAHLKIGLIYKF